MSDPQPTNNLHEPKACPHCGETYYITPSGMADLWVCDICDQTWAVDDDPTYA